MKINSILQNQNAMLKPLYDSNNPFHSMMKKDQEPREKSEVEMMVENMKHTMDFHRERNEVDRLAHKLCRGEKLTREEEEYLMTKDPEKYRKAKEALEKKEEVEEAMRHAKTKEEALSIRMNAVGAAAQLAKSDPDAAELQLTALNHISLDDQEDPTEDLIQKITGLQEKPLPKAKGETPKTAEKHIDIRI